MSPLTMLISMRHVLNPIGVGLCSGWVREIRVQQASIRDDSHIGSMAIVAMPSVGPSLALVSASVIPRVCEHDSGLSHVRRPKVRPLVILRASLVSRPLSSTPPGFSMRCATTGTRQPLFSRVISGGVPPRSTTFGDRARYACLVLARAQLPEATLARGQLILCGTQKSRDSGLTKC